jgi:tRNA pseudouridine55 synthase
MTASLHGLLVIDKPRGITSRAALDRCRRWFPRGTAVGHAGTLDPLATGVLVLCIGAATRLAEYVQQMAKSYRAGLRLGAVSDSDDADGTITGRPVERPPSREEVEQALAGFIGEIEQVPPAYSAAKVTGRRAYELARRGRPAELAPRRVQIYTIDLIAYDYPHLELFIRCGKGTYIRALARDLGERLGCGAYVNALRREEVGPFRAGEALSTEAPADEALSRLLPPSAAVVELPAVALPPPDALRLRQGQAVALPPGVTIAENATDVAVFGVNRALLGIARFESTNRRLLPAKMLPE